MTENLWDVGNAPLIEWHDTKHGSQLSATENIVIKPEKARKHHLCPVLPTFLRVVLCFAHLAVTAFLALSLRSSAVMLAALAGPPFKPPLRPKATAYGFFFLGVGMS
jgi:hypothetical protein